MAAVSTTLQNYTKHLTSHGLHRCQNNNM